jgi:hypothetical protein
VGEVGEPTTGVHGVPAQQGECCVHADAASLGEYALGLLDDQSGVRGVCSCCASSAEWEMTLLCRMLIAATSARALAMPMSLGDIGPVLTASTRSLPLVSPSTIPAASMGNSVIEWSMSRWVSSVTSKSPRWQPS